MPSEPISTNMLQASDWILYWNQNLRNIRFWSCLVITIAAFLRRYFSRQSGLKLTPVTRHSFSSHRLQTYPFLIHSCQIGQIQWSMKSLCVSFVCVVTLSSRKPTARKLKHWVWTLCVLKIPMLQLHYPRPQCGTFSPNFLLLDKNFGKKLFQQTEI